jgi:hypothetical protein
MEEDLAQKRARWREQRRQWREKNPERAKAASRRNYYKNGDNWKPITKRYKTENPEVFKAGATKWASKNGHKKTIHAAVHVAVVSGKLQKPEKCEACGGAGPLHGHHHNGYNREHRLDVQWLCTRCHGLATRAEHESRRPHKIAEFAPRSRELVHGTFGGYQRGCHCDLCRAAAKSYHKTYIARIKAGMLSDGTFPLRRHGTLFGYNLGCKCDPCRAMGVKDYVQRKAKRLANGTTPSIKHGTLTGYKGCKCVECRAASAAWRRQHRAKKKALAEAEIRQLFLPELEG